MISTLIHFVQDLLRIHMMRCTTPDSSLLNFIYSPSLLLLHIGCSDELTTTTHLLMFKINVLEFIGLTKIFRTKLFQLKINSTIYYIYSSLIIIITSIFTVSSCLNSYLNSYSSYGMSLLLCRDNQL